MKRQLLLFLSLILLLAACGAPVEEPVVDTTVPTLVVPTRAATATVEGIATPTLQPTATASATAAPTATARPTQQPTTAPTATALPTVPVDEIFDPEMPLTVVGVEPGDELNVRAQPGANSAVVGAIPLAGQDLALDGNGRQVGQSVWVPVQYGQTEGWVNAAFLAEQHGSLDRDVAVIAWEALNGLRNQDLAAFAEFVHPDLGVCFVPFTYISTENPCFMPAQVATLWDDDTVYDWGGHAATGEPIALTYRDYWAEHIYVNDYFRAPMIGYDTNMVPGGMIDNSAEVFPGSHFVEFHYDGFNPEYGGLDYRTLRIILAPEGGDWYVVAVVDNQWTP